MSKVVELVPTLGRSGYASMAVKLSKSLGDNQGNSGVASSASEYKRRFKLDRRDGSQKSDYTTFTNLYYDLVTDFYEYGWGRAFHFAPRVPG